MRLGKTEEEKSMTCAIRTEFLVQSARAHEFEALWLEIQGVQTKAAGFHDAVLLNSLGYPGKYVAIAKWEDREAFAAFYRSPAFGETARSGDGFYRINRPEEAYEIVLTVGQPPTGPGGWNRSSRLQPGRTATTNTSPNHFD